MTSCRVIDILMRLSGWCTIVKCFQLKLPLKVIVGLLNTVYLAQCVLIESKTLLFGCSEILTKNNCNYDQN